MKTDKGSNHHRRRENRSDIGGFLSALSDTPNRVMLQGGDEDGSVPLRNGKPVSKDVPRDDDAAVAVWFGAILLCAVVLLWFFAEFTSGSDARFEAVCRDNVPAALCSAGQKMASLSTLLTINHH